MIVTTKKAAGILGISGARLRVLLAQGRVEGAYKCGFIVANSFIQRSSLH